MEYVVEALSTSTSARIFNSRGEGLLTPREDQVVNLVAEGIGNREVALQLGIKENTVKKSLLRIYDKLGVSNRVELVLYALTHRGGPRKSPSPSQVPVESQLAVDGLHLRQITLVRAQHDGITETE